MTHVEPRVDPNDIAIVGMALRFPGAHGPAEYWSNLRRGVESVRELSDEELAARGVSPRLYCDPAYVKRAPVLDGVDLFDAEFFGFSPKDAAILDPQHRQFLECCWEALEDAGHPPALARGPIGVFAGCGMASYFTFNLLSNPALVDSVGLFLLRHTGNDKDFLTTRVSYCLDLKGPSINVQTACSTSLVAVHAATQSLILGECDYALAGGVSIEIPHGVGYLHRPGEILSPDGHCHAFDHRAQGTIFGSGAGVVVLRRLEDALRDGDRVYAVVKGSAVNNDGASKVGYLAPSVDGQAAAIAEALAAAGVSADTIEFVEAHGTGTPIGEPVEVAALTQAFARSTSRRAYCGIGSVKANIGHLDTAAGVASLIKAALALHHGELPPTPCYEAPNPRIDFAQTPFYVVDRLRPWPRKSAPRRAGVNSLGVGGTNAHVVLEEAPVREATTPPRRDWQLLCLSARTKRALDDSARRLAAHLRANPSQELADVAFTLLAGRQPFEHRRVLAVQGHAEAAALLESNDVQRVATHSAGSSPAKVVFLLPGGGTQYARMGAQLYASEPVFREHVDRGIDELRRRTGRDLRAAWLDAPEGDAPELERPSLQLPAIFVVEHALAQLWASVGVQPDAMIGHSLGENTAACLSGVLSFEDALGLVALRGELFEELPEGAMLSVPVAAEDLVPKLGPDLDLAAVNAPGVSVVSGPVAALEDLARRLLEVGVDARRIPITTAAHSRFVEPILARFLQHVKGIALRPPRVPFVSNKTGTWITAEEAVRPEYWVDHLRSTVRFSEGAQALLADPARVLLEVGPGKALSSFVRQLPDATRVRGVLATMRHAQENASDSAVFLSAFGRLWACGASVDAAHLWRGERRARVSLPTYAFQRRRHWIEPGSGVEALAQASSEPRRLDLPNDGFYQPVWRERAIEPSSQGAQGARSKQWLVFVDAAGVGEELAMRLRARGELVVVVRESDENRRVSADEWAIDPDRGREGYADLVRELVAAGKMPERVVHLWTLTPDETYRLGSNFFHRNQERGFYSLLFLAQALGEEGVKGPLHVTVVSNGMQALFGEPLLHPWKATLLGPVKVFPRELPGVTCSSVDVPLAVSKTRIRKALRAALLEPIVDQVEREVLAAPRNAVVAWRDDARWEQEFERVSLAPADTNGHAPIKERGVYLVTGGLGGLGLSVAAHMATKRARIVLVGRGALPDRASWDGWMARRGAGDPTSRRIRAVRELEAAGAEVYVASADVTDIEAMRGVIAETRRRFGELDGVVHAAGVLRDAPMLAKAQSEIEEVFAAKVHGTLVLDALLAGSDLDFFVLFSSVSGIVAPPGQVDYVAASNFLDAYALSAQNGGAKRRGRSSKARRTVSIDWGVWSEAGMAANALRSSPASAGTGAASHRPARHPLFESRSGDPDSPLVLSARYSTESHWMLDEHRTRDGVAIVPGTAYVEMARAALVEAGENPGFEIRDLFLLRPMQVADGEAREVEVELVPAPEGHQFRVKSRLAVADASPRAGETTTSRFGDARLGSAEFWGTDERDAAAEREWDVHAEARIVMRTPKPVPALAIEAIEARCAPARTAARGEALRPKQAHLVRFGPRWQCLRELRLGAGEAIATLELDADHATDLEQYGLHPALVDIAATCALELPELAREHQGPDALWVPVSFERLRVHGLLPRRIKSHVRSRAQNKAGGDVLTFDVVIADEDGRVRLEIDGFAMHVARALTGTATASRTGPAASARSMTRGAPRAVSTQAPGRIGASSPGKSALQRNFDHGIARAEGVEALQRVLGATGPAATLAQVVATSLDLDGLRRQADALDARRPDPGRAELEGDTSESADKSDGAGKMGGIERTLAGFWQELLGVRKVGLTDNFFDLGGHSLIAVRLFARIKKTYRVEFPISLLFEAPTIERCAAAIRRATQTESDAECGASSGAAGGVPAAAKQPEPRYTHLVPMHPGQGGEKTPFMLVAGMFGNVMNLRHLAHLLGNERRFYGLQALGLYGSQAPHETFEEMAAAYLAEVRRVQPAGPYLLGGFSGGGITAFEMARQLRAQGEEVALLVMLDTALPYSPSLRANERVRIHWDRIKKRGAGYVTEWARDKLRYELRRVQKMRKPAPSEAATSEFRSEQIGDAFRRALARYEVKHYPGRITLFRPKLSVEHVLGPGRVTNAQREFLFEDNGWGAHAAEVDVHEVLGDHDSMVLEPNVRFLAARLRRCIQEVESAARRPMFALTHAT